jgi:hypothetical protein
MGMRLTEFWEIITLKGGKNASFVTFAEALNVQIMRQLGGGKAKESSELRGARP